VSLKEYHQCPNLNVMIQRRRASYQRKRGPPGAPLPLYDELVEVNTKTSRVTFLALCPSVFTLMVYHGSLQLVRPPEDTFNGSGIPDAVKALKRLVESMVDCLHLHDIYGHQMRQD
jgi:hypothetical protein